MTHVHSLVHFAHLWMETLQLDFLCNLWLLSLYLVGHKAMQRKSGWQRKLHLKVQPCFFWW